MSTDVSFPVPVKNLIVPRGATRIFRLTLEKEGVNVDLSLVGTVVIFTAKLSDAAATPTIQKSYKAASTTLPPGVAIGGITASHIDTTVPPDGFPDTWVADVQFNPADTEAIEKGYLHYDVWLIDSSGQEVPVLTGTLRLTPTVFRP